MGTIGTNSDWPFDPGDAKESNSEATPTARAKKGIQASGINRWTEKRDGSGSADGRDATADRTPQEATATGGGTKPCGGQGDSGRWSDRDERSDEGGRGQDKAVESDCGGCSSSWKGVAS